MGNEDTTFASLVQRTWRENLLFSVLVELTYRCNLDCVFCYNDLGLGGTAMSAEEWIRFFRDLREMQVLNLTLSGGEPTAHPDFWRLGRSSRDLGFVVRVKSNGHALGAEAARRLKVEVDPYMVEVSLHGAAAVSHDRQTRVPGSFDRLVAHVRGMVATGLRVRMNATLTRWNEEEVEGMFALADDLGVRLQMDPEVTPRDDGDRTPLSLSASREGVARLFRLEASRWAARGDAPSEPEVGRQADALPAPDTGKHCGAGSSGITVDPFGNVYPCVQWRRAAGSLHRSSIREIWERSPALASVRSLSADVKEAMARHGDDAPLFNFCPGTAEALSGGNPLALYDGARQRAAVLREILPGRKTIALRVLPE
jgi:radical SAM protein with 4Fe4S-binding SPASM domain